MYRKILSQRCIFVRTEFSPINQIHVLLNPCVKTNPIIIRIDQQIDIMFIISPNTFET